MSYSKEVKHKNDMIKTIYNMKPNDIEEYMVTTGYFAFRFREHSNLTKYKFYFPLKLDKALTSNLIVDLGTDNKIHCSIYQRFRLWFTVNKIYKAFMLQESLNTYNRIFMRNATSNNTIN